MGNMTGSVKKIFGSNLGSEPLMKRRKVYDGDNEL